MNNNVDVDCLENGNVGFNVETEMYNYEPSPSDEFVLHISFVSKELADLRDENKYKDGEFEVNGSFNSSFDMGVYGIIGYTFEEFYVFNF